MVHHDAHSDDGSDTNDAAMDDDELDELDDDDDDEQSKQPRLMRACDHCRRKKIKCNGSRPACSHCLRMRLDCHYSPLVRKKRARRSIIDKLQERLLSIEQLLQPLVEHLAPNDPVVCPGPGGFTHGFGYAPASLPPITHPPGFLPPPGYMQPHLPLQQPAATAPADTLLPPPAVVEELVEIAMLRMTPGAPPVSWARLLRRLRSGKVPEYIIYAAIGIAARFSTRPEFAGTPRYNAGREYAKRAAELISGLVDKPDPDVMFGLVMMCIYEWGSGRGEAAWMYMGTAARLAQRCRLHLIDEEEFTENIDGESQSWAHTEWKRRLWWHVYCGDRASVIVASRPATMHDDDFVVNLPSHDHEWLAGTLPGDSSAALSPQERQAQKRPDRWWLIVELYRVCGRISEFANRRRRPVRPGAIPRRQMFDLLDNDLESLRGKFPAIMEPPPPTADSTVATSDMDAIYLTANLLYHSARIILYRSELPEYEHEDITPEQVERAKAVCIDAAHAQSNVIRWALDNLPVEDWDPMVGVWSLQGASVHVNSALSRDSVVAERSRQDLEAHLKLHVAADQYYHGNMAIVTVLHHVFDLRRLQRLALDSPDASADAAVGATQAQSSHQLVVHHRSDKDPWIVPRSSSFLGFSYGQQELRRTLNDVIKSTTYNPPDIATGLDCSAASPQVAPVQAAPPRVAPVQAAPVQAAAPQVASPASYWSAVPAMVSHASVAPRISFDLSGGLGALPIPQPFQTPDTRTVHSPPSAGAGSNTFAAQDDPQSSAKRSFGGSAGPWNRQTGGKGAAEPSAEQQQQQAQLQRLEDLRARVLLVKQLSGKQPGAAELPHAPASDSAMSRDMDGFLTNFAASIGNVATQLGSADVPPGFAPVSAPASSAAALPAHQYAAWAAAGALPQNAMANSNEIQQIIAQSQLGGLLAGGSVELDPALLAQLPAPTAEEIQHILRSMPMAHPQDMQYQEQQQQQQQQQRRP